MKSILLVSVALMCCVRPALAQVALPSTAELVAEPENRPLSSGHDVYVVSTVQKAGAETTYSYAIRNSTNVSMKVIIFFARHNSTYLVSDFISGGRGPVIDLGPKETKTFRAQNNVLHTSKVGVQVLAIRADGDIVLMGVGSYMYLPTFPHIFP